MKRWQQIIVGFFFIGFCEFVVPIYVILAFVGRPKSRSIDATVQRLETSKLESALGMLPPSEGSCRKCSKALQVGSDFCAYCGTAVRERPLVCQACGGTAPSDAEWCPHCGGLIAVKHT
jgi:RNA polymerase subunit RPABC4/transcription elongation factor Spt4